MTHPAMRWSNRLTEARMADLHPREPEDHTRRRSGGSHVLLAARVEGRQVLQFKYQRKATRANGRTQNV